MVNHLKCLRKKKKEKTAAIINAQNGGAVDDQTWYLDTGATVNAACSLKGVVKFDPNKQVTLYSASDELLEVDGTANVKVESETCSIVLTEVVVSRDLSGNFISWSHLDKLGCTMVGGAGKIKIIDKEGDVLMKATLVENNMYKLDLKTVNTDIKEGGVKRNSNKINAIVNGDRTKKNVCSKEVKYWHLVLNHMNINDLKKIEKQLGIHVNTNSVIDCIPCKAGKITRIKFDKVGIRSIKPFEIIHSDLSGIIRISNSDKFRYYLSFIDDYSRYQVLFLIARKYQVLECFKQFVNYISNQFKREIRILHTDGGTEYLNHPFNEYLKEKGIVREITVPDHPQSNGVAERNNRSINESTRCLLSEANLSLKFWPQAVQYVVYTKNRIPCSAIGGRVPLVHVNGKKINYQKLRKFASMVMVLDLNPENKFSARGVPGLFLCYSSDHGAYEIYLLIEKKIIVARDVYFLSDYELKEFVDRYGHLYPKLENASIDKLILNDYDSGNSQDRIMDDCSNQYLTKDQDDFFDERYVDTGGERSREYNLQTVNLNSSEIVSAAAGDAVGDAGGDAGGLIKFSDVNLDLDCIPAGKYVLNQEQLQNVKTKFVGTSIVRLAPYHSKSKRDKLSLYQINAIAKCPRNIKEVEKSEYREDWLKAMNEEYNSLMAHNTWKLVKRPPKIKVLPVMWTFTTKTTGYDAQILFKARMVVLSNKQALEKEEDTSSPVCNILSIRTCLALAVKSRLFIKQIDVKTAFLNAEIKEDIYIQQPPGFVIKGKEDCVCKLIRALYGLRTSSKHWFLKLVNVLQDYKLEQSYSDECIFMGSDKKLIVLFFVDDLLVMADSTDRTSEFIKYMSTHFDIKDMGDVKTFLGVDIDYDIEKGVLEMGQRSYVEKLLREFGMEDCKPTKTPIGTGVDLLTADYEKLDGNGVELFRSIVGGLNWLSNGSRPDISYVVGILCRYLHTPGKHHLETAKRVLRYLSGTKNSKLVYNSDGDSKLVVFADADFGNCSETSQSINGTCSIVNGCLVGWSSFKQNRVAGSTCESEVLVTLEGVNEAEYIYGLLNELSPSTFKLPITIYNDNSGCRTSVENGGRFKSNKHYKIRLNRIRKAERDGLVKIREKPSQEMIADVFTKQKPFDTARDLLKQVNVHIVKN